MRSLAPRPTVSLFLCVACALVVACTAHPPAPVPEPTAKPPAPASQPVPSPRPELPIAALPSDWSTLPREEFAAALGRWLPADTPARLDERALDTLARALDARDESSVRAAVILARTRSEDAGDVLLARLEKRGGRSAGDVVAAGAFAGGMPARDAARRLEVLAIGPRPHADLDVRVECAAASLLRGRAGMIPFLLAVLREGTPAALERADWARLDPDDPHAWHLQDRAARALSEHAGIECAFRAQASIATRENEIARLTSLLANMTRTAGERR